MKQEDINQLSEIFLKDAYNHDMTICTGIKISVNDFSFFEVESENKRYRITFKIEERSKTTD